MTPVQQNRRDNRRRSRVALLACAATAGICTASSAALAANTPIALTGWNQDLVAETSNALTSTTSPFDAPNNYVFYASGVGVSGLSNGLPVSRTFVSASNSSTTFQYQPYNADNALFFNNQTTANGATLNGTGTLTLAAPTQFTSLALLGAAANAQGTLNYTLNFTNGQSLSETMTLNDWFNNNPYAITSLGRAGRNNGLTGGDNNTSGSGNPRMYETDLTLPAPYTTYSLGSISFTSFTGDQAAIFAVSGAVSASTVYFAGNVGGTTNGSFDTSTANFLTGDGSGSSLAFANGDIAVFDDNASTGNVTVTAGGVQPYSLTFNNNNLAYTFSGGPVTGGGGGVFFNGSSSVTFNGVAAFPGGATLNNGTVTVGSTGSFNASSVNVASGATLTYLSGATAPGLFSLLGTGTVNVNGTALTLGGTTNFNGSFGGTGGSMNLSAGTVTLQNAASAAAFGNGITVAAGASLSVGNNDPNIGLTTGLPVTVTISGVGLATQSVTNGSGIGALTTVGSGTATFAGNIVLASAATISPSQYGVLNLPGNISGTGPLTLAGNAGASLFLSGNNAYTGGTIVTGEPALLPSSTNVKLGSNGGFSPSGGLTINGGNGNTTVDLGGFNTSVAYLSGTPGAGSTTITNSGSTPSVLTITNGNTSTGAANYSASISDGGPGSSNTITLVKTGPGNQILSGNNTYSGGTAISAGTLTVASSTALGSQQVNLGGGTLAFMGSAQQGVSGFSNFVSQGYLLNATTGAVVSSDPATITSNQLTLTHNQQHVTVSAFNSTPVKLNLTTGFTATYTYVANDPNNPTAYAADGAAFVLSTDSRGSAALGSGGGAIGYVGGDGFNAVSPSFAAGFNVYKYNYGSNDIQFGTDGTFNTYATSGLGLTNQAVNVTLTYNAASDLITENLVGASSGSFTATDTVNLAQVLGTNTVYVGFTGGCGDGSVQQLIQNFNIGVSVPAPLGISNAIVGVSNTNSTIQSPVVTGATAQNVGPVTINPGATISLVAVSTLSAPRMVLTTPSVTFTASNAATGAATSGTLNLNSNDLDITNQPLASVTALVAGGYNLTGGANWAGPGITSTAAAASSGHLLAVGVIQNNQGASGQPIYSATNLFDGAAPGSSDVLVKVTYFGDANLDGKVDGSDYSLIDNGYANHLSGWYNGDFNYDGVVDGSDYALIDNAFNNQGAAENISSSALVAAGTALVAGPTAVPEPASVGLIATAAAAGLAGRRRRR